MNAKQIIFTKPYTAELLDVEVNEPKGKEVLIKTEYTAISAGTEKANLIGDPSVNTSSAPSVKFPRTCGYSGTGTVIAVGENVTKFSVGDRVATVWGNHKSYQVIQEGNLMPIPDGVGFKEATPVFISTFSSAALRKMHPKFGESVLVMGLGILGQYAVMFAKASGLVPVIAADPVEERREFALKNGADFALNPFDEDFAEQVKSLTNGGANMCVEVTGRGEGLNQALDCMKKFGRVALLGCTRDSDFTVDYYRKVHAPGITLVGAHTLARPNVESNGDVFTYADDFESIFKLQKFGRIHLENMINEIVSPSDCFDAFTRLANDKNFPIGVLFDWKLCEDGGSVNV